LNEYSLPSDPTIFALATPYGRGAVAVVRVSGVQSFESLKALMGDNTNLPPLREGRVRKLYHPYTKSMIDSALILTFQSPHSFTGEDCVEYHLHGGASVINSLLDGLSQFENHRMALPGEFTRRGFENNKFDLTEAEAIADLINAETESQRLQALDQLGGALEMLYRGWSDRLARLLAVMEADLDFSDQDLPDDILLRVRPNLSDIIAEIKEHIDDKGRGERLRNGIHIVLLGAPNVGKSSIINRLTARDVAIVSPHAGTTRDIVEAHLDIGGYPVIVADMAGLRDVDTDLSSHNQIEQIGIEKAKARLQSADILLHIFDGSILPHFDQSILNFYDHRSILIINKSDLMSGNIPPELNGAIKISSLNGDGYDGLKDALVSKIQEILGQKRSMPSLTRARHRESLNRALDALLRIETAALPELAAEDLRLVLRHIGSITGKVDVEDILDMIFRDFCIGK
jgi:tRNA modification GTPase